jgi:hypothetical protein
MKRLGLFALAAGVAGIAAVAISCRTTAPTSALRDDLPAGAAVDPDTATGLIAVTNCKSCHHSTNFYSKWMAKWATDTGNATTCLAGAADINAKLTCLEAQDDNGTSSIGLWRAYLKSAEVTGWVTAAKAGMAASDSSALDQRFQALQDGTYMKPKQGASDDQIKALIAWAPAKGPNYFKTTPEPTPGSTGTTACTTTIGAGVKAHLVGPDGKLKGLWTEKDITENGMAMFACQGGGDPKSTCFTDQAKYPQYTTHGTEIRSQSAQSGGVRLIRIKDLNTKNTAFWTRSSPDGRFVGNGVVGPAANNSNNPDMFGIIDDLKVGKTIRVEAAYDPGFSPDNQWFTFHGLHQGNDGVVFCPTSMLQGNVTDIDPGSDPRCITQAQMGDVKIEEYHTIATSLDQPFEFVSQGAWENDNGGNATQGVYNGSRVINAQAAFGQNTLNIYSFNETDKTVALSKQFGNLTNQGDFMMSPSTQMVVARFGAPNGTTALGYKIHLLNASFSGNTVSDVADADGGTICNTDASGKLVFGSAKTQFSLDERFIVTHNFNPRYTPANGDDNREAQSSSDVWIYDLLTGKSMQVTQTPVGVYALYPHFRADGWLYFLVRDRSQCPSGTNCPDSIVATDVGLIMGQQGF